MPGTTTLAVVAVAAFVLLGAGLAFWLARRGGAAKAAEMFHFRCTGCKRRLRYQRHQVGHQGQCSNCGRAVTFPPVSQSVE